MAKFSVVIKTAASSAFYTAISPTSIDAFLDAVDLCAGEPCSVTVKPLESR